MKVPLWMNEAGHFVSSAAPFNMKGDLPLGGGAAQSASWFSKENGIPREEMATGGSFPPDSDGGPNKFAPPGLLAACKALASKDAGDACGCSASNTVLKLHLTWGHALGCQLPMGQPRDCWHA